MKIKSPTLLVDQDKVLKNIRQMKQKAKESGAELRPHFKTHHSADIGEWFRSEGINRITCSSVSMAKYFAKHGWKDITIAFPYNPLESEDIDALAGIIQLNIIIESLESLVHVIHNIDNRVNIFLKIDIGTHRTGLLPENIDLIDRLINYDSKHHMLIGLIGHAGHAYSAINTQLAEEIFAKSQKILTEISDRSLKELIISYGDTPTCSLVKCFSQINEIRPGNFTFYDIMQHSFGVCSLSDIAVCMVCPVVAIHSSRNEAVIYGGGVHFSKDYVLINGQKHFGTIVPLIDKGWSNEPIGRVVKLSQEHGIISGSSEYIKSLKVGDLVGVLPIHSCLTADLQGYYLTLDGKLLKKQNRNSNNL